MKRGNGKKIGLLFFILVILTFFVLAISGGGGHGGDKILVNVNSYTMSLQEAVNNNYLKAGGSSPSDDLTTSISGEFHSLDEIFVSVSGSDMSLQQAINSGNLCSSSSGSYSGNVILGHKGDEVTLSSGKSLQQAINDGDYCAPVCGQLINQKSCTGCPIGDWKYGMTASSCRDHCLNTTGTKCCVYNDYEPHGNWCGACSGSLVVSGDTGEGRPNWHFFANTCNYL